MRVVSFNEVKNELLDNMRRGMVLPIIGSGFTRNCRSWRGIVPSGEDYKQYMLGEIKKCMDLTPEDECLLEKYTFSKISSTYHQVVPKQNQETYLRENFTKVELEDHKKNLLSLPWPYIYTLNIDDGIERGSEYQHVVYANREVKHEIFDYEKCVIKLHGDVTDMLTYQDSKCEIFTQEQYVESLRGNRILLKKLEHDGHFQNLLFVGCSLSDEIDLLSSLLTTESTDNQNAKYLCVGRKPTGLEIVDIQRYGISHCVVFDSYDEIYTKLYELGLEAQKIREDDLDDYRSFSIRKLSSSYQENKPYLFFGKSLRDDRHTIVLPYFFISRKESKTIRDNFSKYSLQLLVGSRCSGKTYVLADIACRIRDRDVYLFQTKDRINNQAFETLFKKENCIILIDHGVLSNQQFEIFLNNVPILKKRNIKVVIAANKSNRDVSSILKLYELQDRIEPGVIPQIPISNRFSDDEIKILNPLLAGVNAGLFSSNRTIVDNIIETSEKLEEKNKFNAKYPKFSSERDLAALIAMGTEHKIYSLWAVQLGLDRELQLQFKATEPLIDYESTWSFEKSASDNSTAKYVLNAEYWLWNQLSRFASNRHNHNFIVKAYQYLIREIITQVGKPDLMVGSRDSSYTDYIYFDNINQLFTSTKSSGRDSLALIRVIYEGLNDLLSVDPHYIHQRAKCYIKSSYYEKEAKHKTEYLDKAFRDANLSVQIFEKRYEKYGNEKLLISIDHTIYTQALILCHKCYLNNYSNIDENTSAVYMLHKSLISPYNSYSFAKYDSFNYMNVVKQIVINTIMDSSLVNDAARALLQDLYKMIAESESIV